jgi:hypothetical protein
MNNYPTTLFNSIRDHTTDFVFHAVSNSVWNTVFDSTFIAAWGTVNDIYNSVANCGCESVSSNIDQKMRGQIYDS